MARSDKNNFGGARRRGSGTLTFFFALALVCATLAAARWLDQPSEPTNVTPTETTTAAAGTSASTTASTSTARSTTSSTKKTKGTTSTAKTTVKSTTKATTKATTPDPRRNVIVCIDAGHGGNFPGATVKYNGATVYEKDITLDLARRTQTILEEMGYTVVMTRSEDNAIINTTDNIADVTARVNLAKAANADLLVSFHCNAYAGSGRAYGPIVYYTNSDAGYDGYRLADIFRKCVTEQTSSLGVRAARMVEDGDYAILKGKGLPSILFETGFLTDSAELALMMRDDWRAAMAAAIANSVESAYASRLIK